MKNPYQINDDIKKSSTLDTYFYQSTSIFEESKEKIFAKNWLFAGNMNEIQQQGDVYPFIFLEHMLNEPLVLTHDKNGKKHCLSNVCTHRGNLVVNEPGNTRRLSCRYHGRCFHHNGQFKSMPAFEEVEGFPCKDDHLTQIPMQKLGPLAMISLAPKFSFDEVFSPMLKRLNFLPLEDLIFAPEHSRDYPLDAHWALYCDNYLEGFHIPFVHPGLNDALENDAYGYEIFSHCNLQLGIAKEGEPCFDIPKGHQDYGKNVYAYYFWVFPNLMFNFYPWGLSLNSVDPISPNKTNVRFLTYIYPDAEFSFGDALHQTEMEDEEVVHSVQKGIQSRYYNKGRFSPTMEQGVHHFHLLLQKNMTH